MSDASQGFYRLGVYNQHGDEEDNEGQKEFPVSRKPLFLLQTAIDRVAADFGGLLAIRGKSGS